ncbi:MAG: phospholipase [Phycisphaera sp.]|nr:phospholipase [Phycisphaera sp.]
MLLFVAVPAMAQSPEAVARFEPGVIKAETGGPTTELKYQLLKPAKIEPGVKYPVVLFLHGAGERGDNNTAQLKYLPEWMSADDMRAKYPCFLIAPQCPTERKWGSLDWRKKVDGYADEPIAEAKLVEALLKQVLETQPVDKDRVYLTGLSMGGFGSWEMAVRHPDWFAAVAPICGAGDTSKAKALVGLPIWAWHGDADTAVPVQKSRDMIAAIKAAGGDPKYTELPGVGHNSWTAAYTNADGVIPWLFQQKRK